MYIDQVEICIWQNNEISLIKLGQILGDFFNFFLVKLNYFYRNEFMFMDLNKMRNGGTDGRTEEETNEL